MQVQSSGPNSLPHDWSVTLQPAKQLGQHSTEDAQTPRAQINQALGASLYAENEEILQYGDHVAFRQELPGQNQLPASPDSLSANFSLLQSSDRTISIRSSVEPASGRAPGPGEDKPEGVVVPAVTLSVSNPTEQQQSPRVAILGGGNVGQTLLADIAQNAPQMRPVLLFNGDGTRGDRITPSTGTVKFVETLHGSTTYVPLGRQHFGYLETPAGAQVLQESNIVVVTIPDAPQSRLSLYAKFQQAGLVQDPNRTFVLIRAGQAGQPALSQIIRNDPSWSASMVLVEDSPYGTRYVQTATGPEITGKRKDSVEISVLGNLSQGLDAMRSMFPLGATIGKASWPDFTVVPGSAMPWRFGYAIHPAVAFDPQNLQMTINGQKYLHYVEGVHPQLGVRLGNLDQERVQLAAAYGVHSETFPQKLERQFGLTWNPGESFYDTMQRTRPIYRSTSYGSVQELLHSRYPQEDVPGVFTMNELARRAGLHLPEHIQYEADLRATLLQLGMPQSELDLNLGGYLPIMSQIQGGVPEIKQLLDDPYNRTPPQVSGTP